MSSKPPVQGSLFEEQYLIRTLGAIARDPDAALTELVANAWDAGASEVQIQLPTETGQKLTVVDDGIGMTQEEFHHRWMTLGYNETYTIKARKCSFHRNNVIRSVSPLDEMVSVGMGCFASPTGPLFIPLEMELRGSFA